MSAERWRRLVGGQGLAAFLVLLVLLTVAWPIQRAGWVVNMPPLSVVALLSVGLDAGLISRRWTGVRAHALAVLMGAAVLLIVALGMMPSDGLSARWSQLFNELSFWLEGLRSGEERGGAVEFAMLMIVLFWALGFAGGWQVLRHRRPWALVAPGGLVLLLALMNLSENFRLHLLLFVVASFLLLLHINVMSRQRSWAERRLEHDRLLGVAQSLFIVGFGIVAVSLVWVLPIAHAAPLGTLSQRSQGPLDYVEKRFGRLFLALPTRQGYTSLVWGEGTAFSGTPNLTEKLLFTVHGSQAQGRYWRARVYDVYTGRGWQTSPVQLTAWDERRDEELDRRSVESHDFRLEVATDTLFSAGKPLSFSVPARQAARPDDPGDVLQVHTEDAFFPTRLNLKYSSVSSISNASPVQLREAGIDYPLWVSQYYLQLYEDLPGRVSELAQEITEDVPTQYDKAIAVQEFLLRYPYNLNINAPPKGADGVDFFLFFQQTGYCDYYASSMVVLLRAAGVPARYVLGYAPGQWNAERQQYEVRELNYHSWAEVYFPGYGWVAFEATPPEAVEFGGDASIGGSPDPLGVGEEFDPFAEQEEDTGGLQDVPQPTSISLLPPVAAIAAALFVLALAGLGFGWYRWWGRLSRLGSPIGLYAKMVRLASLAGLGPKRHQTPLEYAAVLSSRLPDHAPAVMAIAHAYVRSAYHYHRLLRLAELDAAAQAWRELRWALVRRLFRMGLSKLWFRSPARAEAGS